MDRQQIYDSLDQVYFSEECDEKDVLEAIRPHLLNCVLFVDVGASLGQFTFFASRCMKDGRIVAIEADPIRFEELQRNCERWSGEPGNVIESIQGALTDREGPLTFQTTESTVSGGLFVHPVKSADVQWKEITVPGMTLDDLFAEENPGLIKIDVEGAELRVLRGAKGILRRGRSLFLVEVHSWADPDGQRNPQEVYDFMTSFGYRRISIHGKILFGRKLPRNYRKLITGKVRGIVGKARSLLGG